MQSKTIYRILAVVLVIAAIYYLFFTGPGTEEESVPQTTETVEQPSAQDSLIAAQHIKETPVQQPQKERPKPKPQIAASEGETEFVVYVVSEGETLQDIAMNVYGDTHKWYKIFAINESRIDDWNVIRTGQKLLVPSY